MNWLGWAIIAMLSYAFYYFFLRAWVKESQIGAYSLFTQLVSGFLLYLLKPSLISEEIFVKGSLLGIFIAFAVYASIKATLLAPNPAYAVAVFSSNIVLLAIASKLLLGTELSAKALLGILLIVLGIFLLS